LKSKHPVSNNENSFETANKAFFSHMKVNVSTRMNPTSFEFKAVVKIDNREVPIQSIPTNSFIVITNESQWCDAIVKIFISDVFREGVEVTWAYFANQIQHHFISNTCTKLSNPNRPLQFFELDHFKNRYFGNGNTVTQSKASDFLKWFSHIERCIRFKRHAHSLWTQGYLFGFMNKEKCEDTLQKFGPNTFLCRFSDSQIGQLVISFVADDGHSVKHYLVKNTDIGTNKSLADFVKNVGYFKYILKIEPKINKVKKLEKDAALHSFYSKATVQYEEIHGYVSTLPH